MTKPKHPYIDMTGKRGIVFGVANDRSYATHIAQALVDAGAECLFTHFPGEKMARRVEKAVESIGIKDPWLMSCDAGSDEDLDNVFNAVEKEFGTIDFIVHSIAFAEKEYLELGRFHETPREVFRQAMDISAFTLLAMINRGRKLMPNGGSVIAMSYYGAEKVVPGYNVMGVAKSALEHTAKYIAAEVGVEGIRVNCISGGPLRTLAAMAVSSIEALLDHTEKFAPLRRNIDGSDVAQAALFLLSPMSAGITGEVMHVDSGFNILCNFPPLKAWEESTPNEK